MSTEQTFAAKLRGLRAERRMTQEELAASVGVSSDSVSKWESGRYMPTLLTTVRIADVLNCSLDHLVGRTATA